MTALTLMITGMAILGIAGTGVAARDALAAQPDQTANGQAATTGLVKPATAPSASKAKSQTAQKTESKSKKAKPPAGKITMAQFLDRLMHAESSGRDNAANPRSSARGAFQFIKSTFLFVARRHFATEVASLSRAQILALRYNRKFARKAARAYSQDNAAYLTKRGAKPTFVNLRLAFLLGPSAAARVVKAPAKTPLKGLLTRGALKANPFMRKMTARDLIARAARDLSVKPASLAGLKIIRPTKPTAGSKRPKETANIKVNCNLSRPSCRRWLALQKRKLKHLSLRQNKAR